MRLRVFVDLKMCPVALRLLREGTAGHELLLPSTPAPSVLVASPPDPLLQTADVAFGQPDPTTVARAPRLRWVHVSSSSITRYDTEEIRAAARQRSLVLSNSAAVYAEPCALHTLSFILAEARRLPEALASSTPGGSEEWHRLREQSVPLSGQSLLIVGFGAIGGRLVELLAPLGMRATGFRRRDRGDEPIPMVPADQLPRALGEANHVVNILPANPESSGFFDDGRFAQFRPGAVFYNIGRGATVDQDALLRALRSGRLKAAWLDVTEPEPLPPQHPLRHEANCHITPHVAGGHADESQSLVRHFLANLRRYEAGEPLMGVVF